MGIGAVLILAIWATPSAPPWQPALVRGAGLSELHTISADARVTVSDGLRYEVITHYRGPQRAVFHREYPDRRVSSGIDGHYFWHYDGQVEREATAMHGQIILGHQFHAALLFPEAVHQAEPASPPTPGEAGCDCMLQTYAQAMGNRYTYRYARADGLPLSLTMHLADGMVIVNTYTDWREVGGLNLPFRIRIDDGERVFDYRFTDIRFNRDERAALRASFERLNPEQQLIRMHRVSMDAHLESDGSLMSDHWADEVTIVSNGQIYKQSRDEADAFMTRSLRARRHSIYDDLQRPEVEVSQDGTLGTVTARVRAEGHRLDHYGRPAEPFRFVSAWTSVFRREGGQWRLISNTSNFETPE